MIHYSLVCEKEHEFEGWFGSSEDFERQRDRGLVACPSCGSVKIDRGLMAPSVSTSKQKAARREPATAPEQPMQTSQMSGLSAEQRQLMSKMRELRDKITANAEDVGNRFSEEARKIHYGDAEARGIYGKAELQEAAELVEEGIEIFPLPQLPEDKN